MIINDRFTGKEVLFQGDRNLTLRSIPVGAQIEQAEASITPVNSSGIVGPSVDDITFTNGTQGTNGETLTRVFQTPGWVEIDFHRRVSLVSILGSDFDGATLQVDIGGGTFIEVNDKGAFKAPGDLDFGLTGNFHSLPGLAVNRIKLTQATGLNLTVTSIKVRNIASNVSLRIGESSPFFIQPGDLVNSQTTVDFASLLQSNLEGLEPNEGFYQVPISLHSDRLTRLDLDINIKLINRQSALPSQLSDVQSSYTYNVTSDAGNSRLTASIPVGARIVSEATDARIEGSFSNSKVVFGGFDEVPAELVTVTVDEGITQAQAFSLNNPKSEEDAIEEIMVDAIDLLMSSVTSQASLQLDLRADLDGKPGSTSLLTKEVEFQIDIDNAPTPNWTSIALDSPITLTESGVIPGKSNQYWLLIQSLRGEVSWAVKSSSLGQGIIRLQQSKDGGMSWRETVVSEISEQPEAQFRLRQNSEAFHIPIEVKVGLDDEAQRLSLAQFEPMGRINFSLDAEELSNTINKFISITEKRDCPQGEQLVNSDFELELDLPNFTLVGWQQTGGGLQPFGNPLSGISMFDDGQISGLSQVVPVVAGCSYELTAIASIDGADSRVELIWSGDNCTPIRTDELTLNQTLVESSFDSLFSTFQLRASAPELATQVEVRIIVPDDSNGLFDRVSLEATPQAIVNSNLRQIDKSGIRNWTPFPTNALENKMLTVRLIDDAIELSNPSRFLQPVALSQSFAMAPGKDFRLEFNGTSRLDAGEPSIFPMVKLIFSKASTNAENTESVLLEKELLIHSDGAESHILTGTIPETTNEVEIQLVVPRDTSLTVRNVLFSCLELREIPITFLSEAPGNLTISDLNVGFEMQPAPLPGIPEVGLCVVTPADKAPGDDCDESKCKTSDTSYCSQCRQQSAIIDPQAISLISDRPALIGRCESCGQMLVQNGGTLTANAVLAPIKRIDRSRIEFDESTIALSEVDYIGKVRTGVLNENGITKMGELAAADPMMLMEVLDISDGLAESLVTQAKKILLTKVRSSLKTINR